MIFFAKNNLILILFILINSILSAQKLTNINRTKAVGIEPEETVMRRDPSDIIKVNDTYYIWYSKRYLKDGVNLFPGDRNAGNGYHAEVWYATSKDGKNWEEQGISLKKGVKDSWDEQSVFTPNILVWKDKYYLFYTGVPKPFTNLGNKVTKSAIGVAVSNSPKGPWKKLKKPVIRCSDDSDEFDSMRVDDAGLVIKKGKIFLYYKGRQWNNTPGNTKMGLATAENPKGPYKKHSLNPLVEAGHEVMIWPMGEGVIALINIGSELLKKTLQFAPDGIHFSKLQSIDHVPHAAGFYRPEAFTDSGLGKMPEWGVEIGKCENCLPGLQRVDMIWKE